MKIMFTLVLLSTIALSKAAQGARGNDKNNLLRISNRRLNKEDKGPKKRDCKLSLNEAEYEFQCRSKSDDGTTEIKDEIVFSIQRSESRGAVVEIKYEQEIEIEIEIELDAEESSTNKTSDKSEEESDNDRKLQQEQETETETKYEIVFDRVIEYSKSSQGGSAAFKWDSDEIIQTMSLTNWSDFSELVESDDGVTSTFSLSTTDGIATYSFTISRADTGESFNANKMKIDFTLTNFPWQRNDTYVALICSVETKRSVEVEYEEGSDTAEDVIVSFEGAGSQSGFIPFGEFTWATSAESQTVDQVKNMTELNTNNTIIKSSSASTTVEVVATSGPNEGNMQQIAFSFIGDAAKSAGKLYWDPEAGVNYSTSSASIIAAGLRLFAALITVTVLAL